MTTTVKLPSALEMKLRQHCAVSGESISDVIRIALEAHLALSAAGTSTSPTALGAELFGRYSGPADLSERYRDARGSVWDDVATTKTSRRDQRAP